MLTFLLGIIALISLVFGCSLGIYTVNYKLKIKKFNRVFTVLTSIVFSALTCVITVITLWII